MLSDVAKANLLAVTPNSELQTLDSIRVKSRDNVTEVSPPSGGDMGVGELWSCLSTVGRCFDTDSCWRTTMARMIWRFV